MRPKTLVLLVPIVLAAGGAGAAEWFKTAEWVAAVTYNQDQNAIFFDTTGALPPQVKVIAGTNADLIKFELTDLRLNPEIYTLAPHDGVVGTIRLEGRKDRNRYWVDVTVELAQAFKYDLERRQVAGDVSQVILWLKDVNVTRPKPEMEGKVPLYARPAADTNVVGFMPYHSKVSVLDYAKGMYLVRTEEDVLGWLPEKYVKIEGENPFKKEAPPPTADVRERVLASAKKYLGVPYVWGGTSDDGFDCSGLVQTVFAENGIALPRGSGDQYREGKKVSRDAMRPGDLVFFHTYTSGPSHVGIYVGDGKFLHAESSPRGVTITPLAESYWDKRFLGARTWIPAGG